MEPANELKKLSDELRNLVDLVEYRDGVNAEMFEMIDWKLLRKQKDTLEKVYQNMAKGKQYNHLRGLGQLIDMLQSVAVEYEFKKRKEVYGNG